MFSVFIVFILISDSLELTLNKFVKNDENLRKIIFKRGKLCKGSIIYVMGKVNNFNFSLELI